MDGMSCYCRPEHAQTSAPRIVHFASFAVEMQNLLAPVRLRPETEAALLVPRILALGSFGLLGASPVGTPTATVGDLPNFLHIDVQHLTGSFSQRRPAVFGRSGRSGR